MQNRGVPAGPQTYDRHGLVPPRCRAAAAILASCVGVALLAAGLLMPFQAARAAACTAEDFAAAVDEAGARLRAFNSEASPKLQAALKRLKDKKGWSGPDADDKAHDFLHDARLQSLDQQADELLVNIDALGRPPEKGPPDCAKLDELKASGVELLAVMRAKSSHTLARIDAALGSVPPPAEASPRPSPAPPAAAPPAAKPAVIAKPPTPAQPPPSATRPPPKDDAWKPEATAPPPPADIDVSAAPVDDGYTIDEIREVTRGFFGTISTELASVIEHAFRKSGRPSAYILGQEGGGAFLAGLRYGKGKLYPRRGGPRDVYWHGPTVGYDFGAEGSRTLFLIYGLDDPEAIHRRFAGIDGSAYLVGGVGITYLRGGNLVLAPIRSGLGLRIGASVGYLRFTPRATWNPF